ncbi:hypothetical protein HanPI659440_Chr13g0507241 [Helianthus annuus]|nr:hypothetical protein HanPI659440_Chr13g0507241 [Helianthus annuus]
MMAVVVVHDSGKMGELMTTMVGFSGGTGIVDGNARAGRRRWRRWWIWLGIRVMF